MRYACTRPGLVDNVQRMPLKSDISSTPATKKHQIGRYTLRLGSHTPRGGGLPNLSEFEAHLLYDIVPGSVKEVGAVMPKHQTTFFLQSVSEHSHMSRLLDAATF